MLVLLCCSFPTRSEHAHTSVQLRPIKKHDVILFVRSTGACQTPWKIDGGELYLKNNYFLVIAIGTPPLLFAVEFKANPSCACVPLKDTVQECCVYCAICPFFARAFYQDKSWRWGKRFVINRLLQFIYLYLSWLGNKKKHKRFFAQ